MLLFKYMDFQPLLVIVKSVALELRMVSGINEFFNSIL